MTDLLKKLPSKAQFEISKYLYDGKKIQAIKCYAKSVEGCDLSSAKEAVENINAFLRSTNPHAFKYPESKENKGGGCGCLSVLMVFAIPLGFFLYDMSPHMRDQLIAEFEKEFLGHKPSQTTTIPITVDNNVIIEGKTKNSEAVVISEPATVSNGLEEIPPVIANEPDYQEVSVDLSLTLADLYRQKLNNPDYVDWKNLPGLPKGYQKFIEEHRIKSKRSDIAKNLNKPVNSLIYPIPLLAKANVQLDGIITPEEWDSATSLQLLPVDSKSILFLQADQDWLYLAADVPGDTTTRGYDQFRFYFHINIDPMLDNERIHVSGGSSNRLQTLGGIRQTNVRWSGEPARNNNERWKKYTISDWRIFRLAQGASSVSPHRQYEAKINLKESGLHIGSPFPAFAVVESDPVYIDKKFQNRVYLGELGSQQQPVWFLID